MSTVHITDRHFNRFLFDRRNCSLSFIHKIDSLLRFSSAQAVRNGWLSSDQLSLSAASSSQICAVLSNSDSGLLSSRPVRWSLLPRSGFSNSTVSPELRLALTKLVRRSIRAATSFSSTEARRDSVCSEMPPSSPVPLESVTCLSVSHLVDSKQRDGLRELTFPETEFLWRSPSYFVANN